MPEAPGYLNPQVREACREAMVRELLLRTFAHDVRGAVMGVMGWVELAAMEGGEMPAGLERSLDRLNSIVGRYDELGAAVSPAAFELGALIEAGLGLQVDGEALPAVVDPLQLLSALELAAPERLELSLDVEGGRRRPLLRAEGLDAEGVQLAMAPHYERLIECIAARGPALGACLLRVVTRSTQGELRGAPPSALKLYFPLP